MRGEKVLAIRSPRSQIQGLDRLLMSKGERDVWQLAHKPDAECCSLGMTNGVSIVKPQSLDRVVSRIEREG